MNPENRCGEVVNASGEVNLLHYYSVIRKNLKSIFVVVVLISIAAVVVSLLLPKKYKAEALIIPISSSKGGGGLAALASQFGSLASLAGINVSGGEGDSSKFVAMLKSRTLTESVIKNQDLMPILFPDKYDERGFLNSNDSNDDKPDMEEAVKRLQRRVKITENKKNKTVKVVGVFHDPNVTARVTNAYIDALQEFINSNAFTVAKRNRMFIEKQLEQNQIDFLEAGKEINEFYKKNRVSATDADVDVDIGINSGPKAVFDDLPKLAAREDGRSAELSNLIAEKAQMEKKIAEAKKLKDVPEQIYLSYLMMRKELLAKVNALLTTQYEMAKIEEAKEDLGFQVIDWAVVPIKRYSPKRTRICISAFFAALIFAVVLAFFREYIRRMKMLNA